MFQRLLASFKGSVTILWARILAAAGILGALTMQILDAVISTPELKAQVDAYVQSTLQPKLIPVYMLVIGLVTELCRRRTV